MSAVADAANALLAALGTASGVRPYSDPRASIAPPAVVLGPPTLHWDVLSIDPSRATFPVYIVTKADDRMLERLWDLVPAVADAAAGYDRAAVNTNDATPVVWTAGAVDLPAYLLSVDVAL